MRQLITPNPHIPCRPGWCLEYVRKAAGLPARYPTATAAWEASTSQHRDRDFPAGVWIPVWYGLDREPAGHVVWRAPDGSVFSTSDNSTIPHHHPDLADLENFYAGWGWRLSYRGWTEDVAGIPVLAPAGITAQGSTTTEEDDMFTDQDRAVLNSANIRAGNALSEATNSKVIGLENRVAIQALAVKQGVTVDYAAIARAVADEEARRMAG